MLKVILLYGGKSGEHEVSLSSAASVLANLNPNVFEVLPVGIDKLGRFYLNDYHELLTFTKALPVKTDRSVPIHSLLTDGRLSIDADVVFPVTHGPLYEDGSLQGLLELAGVAYVGCDVLASAIGMDKDMARRVVGIHGVQYAPYRLLSWHASVEEKAQFCQTVAAELGWPLFVKPCSLGSSVGIHKVNNLAELHEAVLDALRYDESILVEAYIFGREIEVSVLENSSPSEPPKVSIPGEICVNHADGFYSYTAKYIASEQTSLIIPAALDDPLISRLQSLASAIFVYLKCKGLARVDFFVNEASGDIYFNEINTLPGFTSISMYPKLWEASGLMYSDLLESLIHVAMVHGACRQQLLTNYQ